MENRRFLILVIIFLFLIAIVITIPFKSCENDETQNQLTEEYLNAN